MKLSKAQMRVLKNVGAGLEAHHHCRTNSDWGGLSHTIIFLRRRGLLAEDGSLSADGQAALAAAQVKE